MHDLMRFRYYFLRDAYARESCLTEVIAIDVAFQAAWSHDAANTSGISGACLI